MPCKPVSRVIGVTIQRGISINSNLFLAPLPRIRGSFLTARSVLHRSPPPPGPICIGHQVIQLLKVPNYGLRQGSLPVLRHTQHDIETRTDNPAQNTIAENFGGPASALGTHQFRLDQCPDLTGQVAVVTGGSEGIGYGVTHTLLSHNIARVFILSPSASVVAGAGAALANELGPAAAARTAWLQCDLADWAAVAAVADRIAREAPRLDVLVNNAGRGIMTAERTDYGVDRHMAVMHFGHVILTSRLLPLMKRTAADRGVTVRISNQASNVHNLAPRDTRFESLEEINEDVGPNGQYGRAKLAVMLYARWFARHVTNAGHPRLLMNSTHPGFVSTKMSKVDIFEA